MSDKATDLEESSTRCGAIPREAISREAIPASLGRWTATLLSRVAQRMRDRFEEKVVALGLRSKHYGVLILLQNEPLTQIEIARNLEVDRTTMVSLIDDLARLELVERALHPDDRRAYAITLTEKGRQVLGVATRAVDEVEAECFAPLTRAEQKQLRELLQKIL